MLKYEKVCGSMYVYFYTFPYPFATLATPQVDGVISFICLAFGLTVFKAEIAEVKRDILPVYLLDMYLLILIRIVSLIT